MGRSEHGQAVPLLLAVVVVAALLIVAVGRVGAGAADAARARTAADAAALAAAANGRADAEEVAAASGARLVAVVEDEFGVLVRACVRSACAAARARLEVGDSDPGSHRPHP